MQSQPAVETVSIRPKVMRRPAHFAGDNALAVIEPLPAIAPAPPAHSVLRYWQEDARFGLALVVVVLAVNLLLMAALPLLKPVSEPPTLAVIEPSAAAAASITLNGAVTVYAQPTGATPLSSRGAQDRFSPLLSTMADELPIPRAKPLEAAEQ